jgi:dTDP-4-amino-4,6-dideoxygalactose transaminase
MSAIESLEDRLAKHFGRRFCVATGRGATAIWLALQVLAERRGGKAVVLPATLCTSPVAVTKLAGLTPVFCDVDPMTGNLAPAALAKILETRDDIACVMAAHLFGEPAQIGDIQSLCEKHDTPLIEDAAQAVGARIGAMPAGAFGDISIVSFGHTKILDAGGGGAALTDDPVLAVRLRKLASKLPQPPALLEKWQSDYREAYYKLAPMMKRNGQATELVGDLCLSQPDAFRYAMTEEVAERVLAALEDLPRLREHRQAMAKAYSDALAGLDLTEMDRTPGGTPWRYSVLISAGRRDKVAEALRHAGYDASPWYPAVPPFFGHDADWSRKWPAAARIGDEILNLWVDESVDESRVLGACAVIRESL